MNSANYIFWNVYDVLEICFFVYLILQAAANGKIFTKAGEKGGKAIIPIYKDFVQAKISGSKKIFWITLVLNLLAGVFYAFVNYFYPPHMPELSTAFIMAVFYLYLAAIQVFTIIAWVRLAQSFNKSKAFAVGLVLLNAVFILILAFGKSEYIGNVYLQNKKRNTK